MPGEFAKMDRFAGALAALISKETFDGTDGRELYYVLLTFANALGRQIEERYGPALLASIQQAAYEERALQVHAIPPRGH